MSSSDNAPGPSTPSVPNRAILAKGRRRKAGGEGKKGKVFLEDKADLLSLIAGVTSSKEAIRQSRLDKHKSREPLNEDGEDKGRGTKKDEVKEKSASEKKRHEQVKALNQAKATLVEKDRAKKRRRKGQVGSPPPATINKKRVGFA